MYIPSIRSVMSANIPAELSALPIESLIGKPLEAAIRAQAYAAMTTARFIQEVGLDENSNVKNIQFKYTKSNINPDDGSIQESKVTLDAPFLAILPTPYIRIKDMTIHFNFTIKTTSIDSSQHNFSAKLSAKAGWGWGSVKLDASYGFKKETRSSVDRSAELDITVNAVQDEMPEGLKTVLNLLRDVIIEKPQSST